MVGGQLPAACVAASHVWYGIVSIVSPATARGRGREGERESERERGRERERARARERERELVCVPWQREMQVISERKCISIISLAFSSLCLSLARSLSLCVTTDREPSCAL